MELRMRLLSMTLTGMVLTSGVGQAGDRSFGSTKRADGHPGTATVAVNQDQLQGKWKQFKGELKQKWGEFTDDELLAIEGSVDKLEGKPQVDAVGAKRCLFVAASTSDNRANLCSR